MMEVDGIAETSGFVENIRQMCIRDRYKGSYLIILSNMQRNNAFVICYHYNYVQLLALNRQKKKIFEV